MSEKNTISVTEPEFTHEQLRIVLGEIADKAFAAGRTLEPVLQAMGADADEDDIARFYALKTLIEAIGSLAEIHGTLCCEHGGFLGRALSPAYRRAGNGRAS